MAVASGTTHQSCRGHTLAGTHLQEGWPGLSLLNLTMQPEREVARACKGLVGG